MGKVLRVCGPLFKFLCKIRSVFTANGDTSVSVDMKIVFQNASGAVPNCSKCYGKMAKKRQKSVPKCSSLKYITAINQQFSTVNNFYTLYIFWNTYTHQLKS
jgi:hypothetical protein